MPGPNQSDGRRVLFALDGTEQHEHPERQQHEAPDEVDVDAERHQVRCLHRAVAGEQHADECEHEANRPADIESHKFSLSVGFEFGSPENEVKDDAHDEQHHADDGGTNT